MRCGREAAGKAASFQEHRGGRATMSDPAVVTVNSSASQDASYHIAVAIVGMAGRFPDAADHRPVLGESDGRRPLDSLFQHGGSPGRGRRPDPGAASPATSRPGRSSRELTSSMRPSSVIPPREAEIMDPQHRLFLECAWEALEHAAYDPTTTRARSASSRERPLLRTGCPISPRIARSLRQWESFCSASPTVPTPWPRECRTS